MASAHQPEEETSGRSIRFHHGTDQTSATDLLQNGVDLQHAAAWNGSGEFWATSDHHRAEWFARSLMIGAPIMHQPPTCTSWKITCQSSDAARTLQQWLF